MSDVEPEHLEEEKGEEEVCIILQIVYLKRSVQPVIHDQYHSNKIVFFYYMNRIS